MAAARCKGRRRRRCQRIEQVRGPATLSISAAYKSRPPISARWQLTTPLLPTPPLIPVLENNGWCGRPLTLLCAKRLSVTTPLRTSMAVIDLLFMDAHRIRLSLLRVGFVILGLSACSKQGRDDVRSDERKKSFTVSADNVIARATQSRSIVFPLSVSISDSLPDFKKVEIKGSKDTDPQALSFAVYSCSFYEISWFDSTSHWKAIVTPSASSDLFKEDNFHNLSDKEMIDCVRKYYGNSFFYQVRSKGYDTSLRDLS